MKAAPFAYEAPATIEDALDLLARHGDEARVLAGGQSLVPAMNLRLARPSVVIDINRIAALDELAFEDRVLSVGPLVRHRMLEAPPLSGPVGALLSRAAHLIAHPPIRTRGTMVGSLAFADPAAEWCVIAQLLDARVDAASSRGTRSIAVGDLFTGSFTNSLAADELLIQASLPIPEGVTGAAIIEQSHTKDDFAVVVVGVLTVRENDRIRHRVAVGGAAPRATRLPYLEVALDRDPAIGRDRGALAELMSDALDPPSDDHGSADYRRNLAAVLTARALEHAVA